MSDDYYERDHQSTLSNPDAHSLYFSPFGCHDCKAKDVREEQQEDGAGGMRWVVRCHNCGLTLKAEEHDPYDPE